MRAPTLTPRPAPRRAAPTAIAALIGALTTPALAERPVASGPPSYRVHSETLLILDRWRGTEAVIVERTDVRQRLRLDAWRLLGDGPRLDLVADLEIGSDLGPELDVVLATPDARRTVLDLYRAHLILDTGPLDARLGRLVLLDALGYDAVDGAAVELHLIPFVTARLHGGFAARRQWSSFGPELYEPDDTLLRDDPGAVVGAGLRARDLDRVGLDAELDLTWRRHFDDGGAVRDEAGAAALVRVLDPLDLEASAVRDLIWGRFSHLEAGAGLRLGERTRLDAGWRRVHPTFAADSIWNAFVTAPAHVARLAAEYRPGLWRLAVDGEYRRFDADADAEGAWTGGARVDRGFTLGARPARLGLDVRSGAGYGGARHHADLYGVIPIPAGAPDEPIALRVRLGAAHFDVADRDLYDGWAGWALLAAGWQATPLLRLDGTLEGHGHGAETFRLRALARLTVEDLW